MVAFNFKEQFADMVETGYKKQSVRQNQRCKPGDLIQLYTGQRTKKCRKLGDAVCTATRLVRISHCGITFEDYSTFTEPIALHLFAVADGFNDWEEFKLFFQKHYGLPFKGWLHCWEPKTE